ncbi:MAG: hypothetical protein DRG11_00660 [Epsilonproteobacteria bacterium]|nr:MAG: hypothetical protein DRG11_00660 [Campylobacterota bacterium]
MIVLSLFVVVLAVSSLSLDISYKESLSYFQDTNLLNYLTHMSTSLFSNTNLALRSPMILLYFVSNILFFKLTKYYIKDDKDRFIASVIFMILPGIIGSSLMVNNSIIVVFVLILYILYYNHYKKHSFLLLALFLFIDNSFLILYLSLFLYSFKTKDKTLMIACVVLFVLSFWLYGFDASGRPRGYFNDTFSVYLSIFSPFLFLFFVYSLYNVAIKKKTDILWYVSATALGVSFLLSFRQKILLEDFAPYATIAIPIAVKVFLSAYRVRLPMFRTRYKQVANFVLISLVLNSFILLFNKPIYLFLENPKDHFVFKYHFISPLVDTLKQKQITCIDANYHKLQQQLKFYGISKCDDYKIVNKESENTQNIDIKLYDKTIYSYILKKQNKTKKL